jgi:hypothetical protein
MLVNFPFTWVKQGCEFSVSLAESRQGGKITQSQTRFDSLFFFFSSLVAGCSSSYDNDFIVYSHNITQDTRQLQWATYHED